MAISDKINSIKLHVSNAYTEINNKGGTIPTNKNIENLEAAIDSIAAQKPEQEKSVDISENGTINIIPDSGKVLSKATAVVNVQPALQSKTATPSADQQVIKPDASYYGLSQVTVNPIPAEYIIPSGSQTITTNGTYDVATKASAVVNVDTSKPEQQKTVDLAMASGSQVVIPDSGKVLTKVTVNKPDTLIAGNIKSGVNIGGVAGTLEAAKEEQTKTVEIKTNTTMSITPDSGKVLTKVTVTTDVTLPTLNAPSIALNNSTITITNPTSNGGFVTLYNIYEGGEQVGVTSNKSFDIAGYVKDVGTSEITVAAVAPYFNNSPESNNISYSIYTITPTLTNVIAASGNATKIEQGSTKTLTFTAASGYQLPDSVTVTGATGSWTKSTGKLILSNPTANVTFTIVATATPTQTTPVISLASGTTIQIDTIDDNATSIEVFADGTSIGSVSKQ